MALLRNIPDSTWPSSFPPAQGNTAPIASFSLTRNRLKTSQHPISWKLRQTLQSGYQTPRFSDDGGEEGMVAGV